MSGRRALNRALPFLHFPLSLHFPTVKNHLRSPGSPFPPLSFFNHQKTLTFARLSFPTILRHPHSHSPLTLFSDVLIRIRRALLLSHHSLAIEKHFPVGEHQTRSLRSSSRHGFINHRSCFVLQKGSTLTGRSVELSEAATG
jgi:hypothetical protein